MRGHGGRDQKRYGGEKKQAGLESCSDPVELLNVIPKSTEQEACAQHKQRIRHDRSRDRRLHQCVLSRLQSSDGDDKLGEISERGVQQTAYRIAGLRRD